MRKNDLDSFTPSSQTMDRTTGIAQVTRISFASKQAFFVFFPASFQNIVETEI
jgi:hypothetical protein